MLQLPSDTWLSIYFVGVERQNEGLPARVTLLRGERPGVGNVQSTLEWLSKPHAVHRLFVKNLRKRPHRLSRQPVAFLDEREALLARRTGQVFGLDWETQVLGAGHKLPTGPIQLDLGDAIMMEVPKTDDSGEFRFVSNIYMDSTSVLSRPVEENIVAGGGKKKKRRRGLKAPRLAATTQRTCTSNFSSLLQILARASFSST